MSVLIEVQILTCSSASIFSFTVTGDFKQGVFFISVILPIPGLPPSGSWQDLKDHMREAGDVCFADVQRDGEGVVEFLRREDMEYALRRLDRTEFRSHQVSASAEICLSVILEMEKEQIFMLCLSVG